MTSPSSTSDGQEPVDDAVEERSADAESHPSGSWWPLLPIAVLTYLPMLLTRPGWVSADTKTYLYLDPGRLMDDARSTWDAGVGLGTVTHQTVGYLWPMGPWYWMFDQLGVPDWVAQRLWWGTLLFAGVAGAAFLLRRFEIPPIALWPAALAYGLSPYAVAYLGRLSGVMMPAVGLPWLLGLTILSIRRGGWRHPALFALVATTVGSVNLTALVLVGIAPLLWVVYEVVTGSARVSRVAATVARIGVLTTLCSAWWLAGLTVQASHGIDIVRYSESAEVVSRASTSFEVLRGLGYWFFYGGEKLDHWIQASPDYTQRPLVLAVTFAVPVLALLAATYGRWKHRRFFAALMVVGVVVAVGAHPWDGPSPIGSVIKAFLGTERGLAFRSLPRAVPVVALAAAVLAAGGLAQLLRARPRAARAAAALLAVMAILAMVPLWERSIVQDSLSRREIPQYWLDAAELIDERDDGTRVLEVPGSEFASYRWGNTIDPITPGLIDRPYVARELVPYGTPPSADLLNAFDLLLQERTLPPEAIAPVARLFRAGDILVRGDLQYERYNIARPRQVWDQFSSAPGLGEAIELTAPYSNEPPGVIQLHDEVWLMEERFLADGPAVAVIPVDDAPQVVGLKPAAGAVVVSGDGAGLVDAAGASLIDGTELIRYSADLDGEEIATETERGASFLVTDSNRLRGERWGSLRHTRGYTERADEEPPSSDLTDNRLPRFADRDSDVNTVMVQDGGVTVDASSYGNPITFAGDNRAALAIDGDLDTAWSTAAFSDARGESLTLALHEPLDLDHIVLHQLSDDQTTRAITRVRIDLGDDDPVEVDLGAESRSPEGQRIDLGQRTTERVEITILTDTEGFRHRYGAAGPVGLAEVTLGADGPKVDEVVRMPSDLTDALEASSSATLADRSLTYLMTRLRQDPADHTRDDEERAIVRRFDVPDDREFGLSGTARISARAEDRVLDRVLGVDSPVLRAESSARLSGSRMGRASAAFDGDETTAWTTPFGTATGESIKVSTNEPRTFDDIDLAIVSDGDHSVPHELIVRVDGEEVARPLLPVLETVATPGHVERATISIPPTTGSELEIEISTIWEVQSVDWITVDDIDHPVAIAEIGVEGLELPSPPVDLDDRCRDDLLLLDGEPIGIRVVGSTNDASAGAPLEIVPCDAAFDLSAGTHEVRSAPGADTGIDIDQLVLAQADPSEVQEPGLEAEPPGRVEIVSQSDSKIRLEVSGLDPGEPVWLVLGQSHSDGWRATIDGNSLDSPRLVDGFANGWLLEPDGDSAVVELDFTPQRRLEIGILISLFGAALCALLALKRPEDPDGDEALGLRPPLSGGPASTWAAVTAGAVVVVGCTLLGSPLVGLGLGALAVAASLNRRAWGVLSLLPAASLGFAALYLIALVVRYNIEPGIEWVTELQRIHPIGMAAVGSLAADLVVETVRRRFPAPSGESSRTAQTA